MPIDPSIALGIKPVEVPNMLQTALTAQSLNNQGLQANVLQQHLQQQQIANQNSQLDMLKNYLNFSTQQMAGLINKPDLTLDDVHSSIDTTAKNFGIPPQVVAQMKANVPQDPARLREFLTRALINVQDKGAQLGALTPSYGQIGTGSSTLLANVNPNSGVPVGATAAGFQHQLSPGEATAPTAIGVSPGGVPIYGTRQQFIEKTGGQAGYSGRYQPQQQSAGPIQTQPNLGVAEDVGANVQRGQGFERRAASTVQNKALLDNMQGSLQQFTSGPKAEWANVGKAFANQASPFGDVFDPKKIASQEEFNKQAIQLAQSQFSALGGTGTDTQLDSAMHTNPSAALSKLGNQRIINMLKGNEDALAVMGQEWQRYKEQNGPASFGKFQATFQKNFDPRIFQSQYMTPAERAEMKSGMSSAEWNKFSQAYNNAVNQGWIQPVGK